MRNVWKGLIIGGLTGVAAGILLDGERAAVEGARQAGNRLRDADLADRVRGTAGRVAHSHAGDQARAAADRVAETARQAGAQARDVAVDAAAKVAAGTRQAADHAHQAVPAGTPPPSP